MTATLALAFCLLGCGSKDLPGAPVPLLTGDENLPFGLSDGGCFTAEYRFMLVADSQYGTRTGEDGVPGQDWLPVMWPQGYTSRRLITGEVTVLDRSGTVVATTGHTYRFGGGSLDYKNGRAWYACSYVIETPNLDPVP